MNYWIVAACAVACACSRAATTNAVEPVTVGGDDADATVTVVDAAGAGDDAAAQPDSVSVANVGGGLWIVDATGQPVGVLINRGFPSPSAGGALDALRDGVLVYSPKAGVFFGLQMSTGAVIAPRIGVTDSTCTSAVVAGYYVADASGAAPAVSGQGYAFVFNQTWYRIDDFKPTTLVSCGGTVEDGVNGVCSPHAGTCRGFPVTTFNPPLPTLFPAPLAFSWLAK